jgi:hypothetical protein
MARGTGRTMDRSTTHHEHLNDPRDKTAVRGTAPFRMNPGAGAAR